MPLIEARTIQSGQGQQDPTDADKKNRQSNNPQWLALVRAGGRDARIDPDKWMSDNHPEVPKFLVNAGGQEAQLPIETQQQLSYENILTNLADYQSEENRRFQDLQAEAQKRDETRTREYQSLMSDFSNKLAEAETKRGEQYTSFMNQLTQSFTDAENVRKAEKKALDDQMKAERDLQLKTEFEKKTLLENTTAQQIQRMRLRGTAGRKPTIKTSNVGLVMTELIGSPQAIGI